MVRNRYAQIILAVGLCALIAGCLSTGSGPGPAARGSNLTPGMVKTTLEKGVTTQTRVLEVFGAPNIVTGDSSGRDVWTYDVQYTASEEEIAEWSSGGGVAAGAAGTAGTTPILGGGGVGGKAGRSSRRSRISSGTFTLMITFDNNEIVQDYRMMSTRF